MIIKATEYKKAVIYCRVSSERQVQEGHGLESQEQRCRQRAMELNLEVVAVFKDEAVSGSVYERPGMNRLINFLDKNLDDCFVVIIDDISRLARDVTVHWRLRVELRGRRAKLECINLQLDDTYQGEFVETIFSAKAALDRKQNRHQVMARQKARLELGYWTFCNPPGLKFIEDPAHGRLLVPSEPLASIFKEAIERFASFELSTLEAVREFITNQYHLKDVKRALSLNGTTRILNNKLYAGVVMYEPWGVEAVPGRHTGLVNLETHLLVLDRLKSLSKPRLRKDYNEDFPLRNFLLCSVCNKPCTAAWFKGKCKKFAYYLCKQKGCTQMRKCIGKNKAENDFIDLVKKFKIRPKAADAVMQQFRDVWERRAEVEAKNKMGLQRQVDEIERKIGVFIDRISDAQSALVAKQYELEVEKLVKQKECLEEEIKKQSYSIHNFERISKVVVKHLIEPIKLWENKDFSKKRMFLSMYFSQGFIYDQKTGFQTPNLPLIVKLLMQNDNQQNGLVENPERS